MTIREISNITGLSTATICKALKDPSSVKKQTWELIEKVKEASTNLTKFDEIHVILPNLKNQFFIETLSGIIEYLSTFHIAPQVHISYEDSQREKKIFSDITNSAKIGVIWIPSIDSSSDTLPQQIAFQIVVADRDIENDDIRLRILSDNTHMAKIGTEYLISKGAQHLCMINGEENSTTSLQREQGFRDAIKQNNISEQNVLVKYSSFHDEKLSYQITKSLMKEHLYDAYLLGNQTITYGFLRALKGMSTKLPIHVMTFDNIPIKELLPFPISMIVLPANKIGVRAAQMLLESQSRSTENLRCILEGSLYIYS